MSTTTVTKKTTRRVISSDGKETVSESVSTDRHSAPSSNSNYQVFRGMSPTTQSRLENRVKELEGELAMERESHDRTHTEVRTLHIQIEGSNNQLELAEKEIASQIDIVRRRDQELLKAKRDFELSVSQHEASETSLKKRFVEQINELHEQLERANKVKSKIEKEKQQLIVEVEGLTIQIDEAKKAKTHAESTVESLQDQLKHHRLQLEEFAKSNSELTNIRTRLTQENADLQHQLQDIEAKYSSTVQLKIQIQQKLDINLTKLEEEKKNYSQLGNQLSNVRAELDRVRSSFNELSDIMPKLQSQLHAVQTENQVIKARYDKDITIKVEEFEELKRNLSIRVTELEVQLDQFRTKSMRLEKEKSKLIIQIEEITNYSETIKLSLSEHTKLLKQAETNCAILQKRNDELNIELQNNSVDANRLQTELIQAKQSLSNHQEKIDSAAKENYKLIDIVHELENTVKDVNQQHQDCFSVRIQLQTERDVLQSKFSDANDTIHELQLKLETSYSTINQLKIDGENVNRGKNEEIESIRKGFQRTIEELHLHITELESRFKTDSSRWKQKIENERIEFELQIDLLNQNNSELLKINKNLDIKVKEIETMLEVERKTVEKMTELINVAEHKLQPLQTELEEIRVQLLTVEKSRKNAESETAEHKAYILENNIVIQTLTVDKRRVESDLAAAKRQLDDFAIARKAAEESSKKLASDLSRLNEHLLFNKSSLATAESKIKQLEMKNRELVVHIEQLESAKDDKRNLAKLQSQITELERALDWEQKNGRDLAGEIKKLQRLLSDMKLSSETERIRSIEYTTTINTLESRITTLKRQLEDSGEMLTITLAKYRKTQQLLEDAEHRADKSINVIYHKTVVAGTSGSSSIVRRRSYSVTRENSSNRQTNY